MSVSSFDGGETTSDAELVLRTVAGDVAAVEALYRRHHRKAVGYAMHLVGDWSRAEDLASEAFLRMWESISSGRTPTRPGGYLCRTVRNLFIDQIRRDSRLSDQPFEDGITGAAFTVGDIASGVVERDALSRAARSIPQSQVEVLWESVVMGYSTPEVARRHSLATLNAGAQLAYRARRSMRLAYEGQSA